MTWLTENPEFVSLYEAARLVQADVYAEQTLDIADKVTDDPACRKVRIETRKWFASVIKPKKYGQKLTSEHTGEGGGPMKVELSFRSGI